MTPKRVIAFLVSVGVTVIAFKATQAGVGPVYGAAALTIVAAKVVASVGHRAPTADSSPDAARRAAEFSVGVVVPVHNEDPAALHACIKSIAAQPQVGPIVVVDDGSKDRSCITAIDQAAARWPGRVHVIRFATNRGKREALHASISYLRDRGPYDVIVTVDSDTVLAPNAVEAGTIALVGQSRTGAVTGLVRAANWQKNILTRLQDLRYASAFLWERAAYSRAGSVLCVCGSFTVWRAALLEELIDPLVAQTWGGQKTTFGDDRHLTNLALRRGWRVRFAETAVADTLVPERLSHWLRQQTRWSRSFIRESLWAIRHLPFGWAFVLSFGEMVTWAVFTVALIVAVFVKPLVAGSVAVGGYVLWVTIGSWARSIRFFEARPEATRRSKLLSFALAPVYGVLHLFMIVPMRLVAVATLTRTRWGTREQVEVSLTAPAAR